MAAPLSFRWDEAFIERVDAARGSTPRSAFVREAVLAFVECEEEQELATAAKLAPAVHRHITAILRPAQHHLPRCTCPVCRPPKPATD